MKQLLILLFIMGTLGTSIAQTPYLLRGIIIVKGAENKPINNVSVKIIGSNPTNPDSYGGFTLECVGKKAGDKVALQLTATGYVVLSLNGLIKPDRKNILEITLPSDVFVPIKIEIQKESELKSDFEKGLTKLNNQIAAQTQQLKALSAKTAGTNAERAITQQSIEKINQELKVVLQKLDSIGKPAEVNGFLPLVEQIGETRKQLEKTIETNQREIIQGLDDLTERDDKQNFRETAISDEAFNTWNIIGKINITPLSIKKDKIVMNLDIDSAYQGNPLLIKLIWNGQNRDHVSGTGDGISFEPTKKLTWEFSKEGLKKEDILTGNKLNIFVYSKYNMPTKKKLTVDIIATSVGSVSLAYGLILRDKALKDYAIYKSKTNENEPVYDPITNRRNGLFDRADKQYSQAPFFGYIGGTVAAAGIFFLVKKIVRNKAVVKARRKSLLDFVPDKQRVIIAPVASPSGSLGLGVGMKF